MKSLFLTFLLTILGVVSVEGQVHNFTSPYTQIWPNIFHTEIEEINRTLTIEPGAITLATQTKNGKIFEKYIIQEIRITESDTRLLRKNGAGTFLVTVIIPHQQKIEIIDIYRPSLKSKEMEHIRLWVN